MPRRIRLATYNAENFSLLLHNVENREALESLNESDYLAMNPSIYNPNKERSKIAEMARLILKGNYDLVGLCEVGGLETLEAFNRLYLKNRFDTYLHEENSRRGIFVGALVKKGRFPDLKVEQVAGPFARNLMRLSLGVRADNIDVYVVHLKSQHGADRGLEHRMKEISRLSSLVKPTRTIVMGDFNGIAIRGEAQFEYEPLLALPVVDVLEAIGVPASIRRTHYYFDPAPRFTQLDYIFCTTDLDVLKARILEGAIPLNSRQRSFLASDHLMLEATVGWGSSWWQRMFRRHPPRAGDVR